MADRKLVYANSASITITLTSLGAAAYRESTAVDNGTNLYLDAFVGGITQIGTLSADGQLEIYAYGSWNGTSYTGGVTGADAAITWGTTGGVDSYNDLIALGVASCDTSDDNDDVEWGPFSIAAAFGGRLPPKWGIVVKNSTNATLHATGTNNAVAYRGVYETIT
jgi:hypothetical protein